VRGATRPRDLWAPDEAPSASSERQTADRHCNLPSSRTNSSSQAAWSGTLGRHWPGCVRWRLQQQLPRVSARRRPSRPCHSLQLNGGTSRRRRQQLPLPRFVQQHLRRAAGAYVNRRRAQAGHVSRCAGHHYCASGPQTCKGVCTYRLTRGATRQGGHGNRTEICACSWQPPTTTAPGRNSRR